jgi:hypothetical protein
MCVLSIFFCNLCSISLDNTFKLLLLSDIFVSMIFYYSLFYGIQVIFVSITSLIILLFSIYCAFMLCYNNACSQFTDIIKCVGTGVVLPSLIWVHEHAVIASATTWQTRHPVCIVQGCPIAPLPGSLHTHTHHSALVIHTQLRGKTWKLTLEQEVRRHNMEGGGGYDGVKLSEKSA